MARIGSEIPHDAAYERNYDYNREQLRILQARAERLRQGGGAAAQERLRARGKLPARERIQRLIDPGTTFLELGLFAAYDMYTDYGGCPAAGVIIGIGIVSGRECIIVANDASVKAGAWFPMTTKKNLRAQELALENRTPIIYLVDSAGVFLPLQDEVFPDKEHFGRIFYNNARLSSLGVPQIAAIMGPCVAGGAYLPIMSDEAIIVEGTGSLFLAGPALVEAAIGEKADIEELGGARMHASISGVVDYRVRSDEEALALIRSLMAKLSPRKGAKPLFDRDTPRPPAFDPDELLGILPADRTKPYDTYQLLARILDDSELDEYKAEYGKTLICGYGRIDGWAVGIVANQRAIVRSGRGELQIGGVIYSDSADKAARFIMNCNQRGIPLVFFQDVTGFMVGTRAEQGGIIKDGAKMVNAVANSVVPKITIIVGNSFGAGNYAMCGRAYDPRLILAYPTARIGVMGGVQASRTLLTLRLENLKREGKSLSAEEQQALLRQIEQRYEEQLSPYYAAARLWVDELISPLQTREYVSRILACAAHAETLPAWSVGVLQT